MIANLSVENILCQLKGKSTAVPAPAPATEQQLDLQTANMQAESESKRKADEVDPMTEESSDDEELKDVENLNEGDNSKPAGKVKVNREEKKERKAARSALGIVKGSTKGTASVQK